MPHRVKVESNTTHWQSRDIGKMVRLCLKAAGAETRTAIRVRVDTSDTADWGTRLDGGLSTFLIKLSLPKRGRSSKAAPITQLAEATLGKGGDILPLHQTYSLAKRLTVEILKFFVVKRRGILQRTERIKTVRNGSRPYWIPEGFSVRKYAPKKKAVDTRTFVERVENDIARTEERVEQWEAEIEHAETHLKRAQRDLKKHQRRLREAKKRRTA